jgi:hypothetical protein
MNASNTEEITHTDTLRETMLSKLREVGAIRSDRVADAFRTVPGICSRPGHRFHQPVVEARRATATGARRQVQSGPYTDHETDSIT